MASEAQSAVIIGAGLAGSLLACALAQRGWKVDVFERRPDPRAKGYVGGRSINLALSARGLAGLRAVGLEKLVMEKDAIPMRGRMLHGREGKTGFQPYSSNPADAINSVSRGGLNLTLLEAAAALPGVSLHFDCPCTDIDLTRNEAIFVPTAGSRAGKEWRVGAELIVGADGAFSAARLAFQKTDRFEFSQNYLEHGYKELHIPPGAGGAFRIEQNALHIWPRGGAMMIALPNRDGSFTCTLFWPFEGEHSFAHLKADADIRAFFEREYPDAVPLMPTLVEDFQRNPTSSLVTVRCWPWVRERACLLGDAAHAIVPFYGQGMNCAFEDCVALVEHLDRAGADISNALDSFQRERKPNAEAIADMAIENFVEMRDKVGRPEFLYRKKVEQAIHAAHPDRVTPQYNLVSFSTVPYAESRRRGRELDAVIDAAVAAVPRDVGEAMPEPQWRERVAAVAGAILHGRGAPASGSPDCPVIDISPALTPAIKVWPGDTALSREVLCDIERGSNITLSTLRATVHLGSHADGPNHYAKGGGGVGEQPLAHYIGPCRVIEARTARGSRIRVEDLVGGIDAVSAARVLFRTNSFPDPNSFNEDFAALSVELVDALAARGVITIGIDTPSVDLFSSKALEAHQAIFRHGIAILEGLVLSHVVPGEYQLIAPPLKLMGFDASPVRAVLLPR